jgi:hypothetical protein
MRVLLERRLVETSRHGSQVRHDDNLVPVVQLI